METLEGEIAAQKSKLLLDEYKNRIVDTAKNIKSNDATFNLTTLPQVRVKLVDLMKSYIDIYQKVEASEAALALVKPELHLKDTMKLDDLKDLYQDAYQTSLHSVQNARVGQQDLSKLTNLILPQPPPDEEIVVEPMERRWPKDPITQTNIKKAVRNKVCKHLYDNESIRKYIERRKATKEKVACPVAGCRNKNIAIKDILIDDDTNALIESLRDQQ